jgi:hypothetical protein
MAQMASQIRWTRDMAPTAESRGLIEIWKGRMTTRSGLAPSVTGLCFISTGVLVTVFVRVALAGSF